MLTRNDIDVMKSLAREYAEIAALPVQGEKRRLWIKLNTISMERPMLLIDQIPWNEMDVDGFLTCHVADKYWQRVECEMRRTIYKWRHMPADMVVDPYVCLPRPINNTGWGIDVKRDAYIIQEENATASSSHFVNQFEEMEDIDKIQTPVITLDTAREQEIIAEAHSIFDGIIDFRMTGTMMHLGIWDTISHWMGVENCYIELMDRPELMHGIMEKLTTGLISMIEQMNRQQLFDIDSNMCHCSHTYLPDMPKEGDLALSGNAWAFGLAQLFTAVSPDITAEFELPYMKRVFPYFGAIYYGCCDRLDDRMDVIAKLPKIRKLSCSPWSNREPFAEKMPDYCVMSNKPNPAYLANGALNEDVVRKDIRRTIDAAKAHNRSLELILKDISTVKHNPACLWRWQEIAMEELTR
ncbi:MAG: hypothetical protein IJC56_10340 [Clostridia bacterium]|nr:hypothetical protein [Clostridia bacterium]